MVRAALRSIVVSCVFAGILQGDAASASAQDWTANHGVKSTASSHAGGSAQSSQDDPDEVPPLIVTGDFNRDGIADIASITSQTADSSEPRRLIVLLGQANGTFKTMNSQAVPGGIPRAMVGGDFNRDGVPDLIVGDEDGTLTLFLGDGTGRFNSVREITHLVSAISIAMADFNHDGILDIAISDWRASSVTVLLGDGKGSFGHMWSFPLRMRGTKPHLAAADFNGDGVPDLAVIYDEDEGDTFDVMLSNVNGTFTLDPEKSFTRDPNSHCNTLVAQ